MNIKHVNPLIILTPVTKLKTSNRYFLPILLLLTTTVLSLAIADNAYHLNFEKNLSYCVFSFGCIFLTYLLIRYSNLRECYLADLQDNKLYTWLILFAFICFTHYMFHSALLKRTSATAICFVLFTTHLDAFKKFFNASNSYIPPYSKMARGYIIVIFFLIALPGVCIPPFTSGIAGWTVKVNPAEPIRLSGIRLVNDKGESIWFSHGIISPFNFMYKQIGTASNEKELSCVLDYYFMLYKNRFSLLRRGIYPNQKYLRALAYPGHNPYRMLNYKAFPPESIVKIAWAYESYNPITNAVIEKKIYKTYDLKTKLFDDTTRDYV